jgi:midasin
LLIDEMNLAQQSILEGLNAILDHRRTVYIPELNKEFICHPNFFVFACQNPSQSAGSTTGRKTLPKSFLNRFIKIYLEDLTHADFELILDQFASDVFQTPESIRNVLKATKEIESESKGH